MSVQFRNVAADPRDPVESWPYEALVAALERGGFREWQRIAAAINAQPWGPVARGVEEYLAYERPYGVAPLMERVIASARRRAERDEKDVVAARIRILVAASGLSRAAFAAAIGTSASRLSTYCTGTVTPSAAMVLRMERAVDRAAEVRGRSTP